MGPGATLDKRRPDLRDELGYIAPPNRKLPPVPGSNYNTCDRIKRGTVISKHLILLQHLIKYLCLYFAKATSFSFNAINKQNKDSIFVKRTKDEVLHAFCSIAPPKSINLVFFNFNYLIYYL